MITDCLKLSDDDYVIGGRQRMSFSINEVVRLKNVVAFFMRFGMFNKLYQKPTHTLCHMFHEVRKYVYHLTTRQWEIRLSCICRILLSKGRPGFEPQVVRAPTSGECIKYFKIII